jgi:hypothetical protein
MRNHPNTLRIVLCFALSFYLVGHLPAQLLKEPVYRANIKINPLSILLLTGNLKGEWAAGKKVSIQLGTYYGGIKTSIGSPQSGNAVRYRQWAVIPEVRFFFLPSQSAPEGLYIAPYLRYRSTDMELVGAFYDPDILGLVSGQISNHTRNIGGGAVLGYQFIGYKGFVADAFFGFSVNNAQNRLSLECETCNGNEFLEDATFNFGTGGFGTRFGLGMGYAF